MAPMTNFTNFDGALSPLHNEAETLMKPTLLVGGWKVAALAGELWKEQISFWSDFIQ